MKQTHPNCKNPDCPICFVDHIQLQHAIEAKTQCSRVDHLGKYHKWLSDHGITPETETGWATPAAFDDANVEAYVSDFLNDQKE